MSFREWAEQWAVREWADVKRVPLTLVILAALTFGAGWWVAQRFYAERIEVLQLRLSSGVTAVPAPQAPVVMLFPRVSRRVGIAMAVAVLLLALFAVVGWRRVRQQRRDLNGHYSLLQAAVKDRARFEKERDEARTALRDRKQQYAMEVLERYSGLRHREGTPPTQVTVQYANYGDDYELAQKIEGLFTQYVKWPVTLELATKPALPRADRFKVVFDVGMTYTSYGDLVHAFSEGDLIGVQVGWKRFVDREDSHNLIVMVLPSTGAVAVEAEPAPKQHLGSHHA